MIQRKLFITIDFISTDRQENLIFEIFAFTIRLKFKLNDLLTRQIHSNGARSLYEFYNEFTSFFQEIDKINRCLTSQISLI